MPKLILGASRAELKKVLEALLKSYTHPWWRQSGVEAAAKPYTCIESL